MSIATLQSIGGWTVPSLVSNARWTGQPCPPAPGPGKYATFYAIDSQSPSYWDLIGSGFGQSQGSGKVAFSDPAIKSSIASWTDSKIRVNVSVPSAYTQSPAVAVRVNPAAGNPASKSVGVVGSIQARGYGQCTWFVAMTRLQYHRPIPTGALGAFSVSGPIGPNYVPQQWDVLQFEKLHTAIIASAVLPMPAATDPHGNKVLTYTFTIQEMNAHPAWGEAQSSFPSRFAITVAKDGSRSVSTGILSYFSQRTTASGYYR